LGPLIGASEEDLMDLAIGRSGSLWSSLQRRASSEPRFAVWRDYLLALAAQADQKDPFAWLSDVLVLPCPFDPRSGRRAFASRLGPDAEDPLDELLRQAQAFSARHVPSLHLFLDWLLSSETDIKREMEQGEDRVRIMTVHASKGLEAPVVILPDSGDRYISKCFDDEWMKDMGYLGAEHRLGTVRELLQFKGRHVEFAGQEETIASVVHRMRQLGISQMPIQQVDSEPPSMIREVDVLHHLVSGDCRPTDNVLRAAVPLQGKVALDDPISKVQLVFDTNEVAVVMDEGRIVGIIGKIDVVEFLAARS